MKGLCVAACFALVSGSAFAADFALAFTEHTLNRLLGELGNPSAGGIYQPSNVLNALGYSGCSPVGLVDCSYGTGGQSTNKQLGISLCRGPDGETVLAPSVDYVPWQWWITEARFAVAAQQLTFSANVRYRIGSKWFQVTRTVPASLTVDLANQQLRMNVSDFTVPIRDSADGVVETLADVDVGRYMSFAIPMSRQTVSVHDLAGNARTMTSRIDTANVQYLPGRIVVAVDGRFN
jgi:hypothetical protein